MDEQVVHVKVKSEPVSGQTHESFAAKLKHDLEEAGHVVLEVALFPLVVASAVNQE